MITLKSKPENKNNCLNWDQQNSSFCLLCLIVTEFKFNTSLCLYCAFQVVYKCIFLIVKQLSIIKLPHTALNMVYLPRQFPF